MRIESILRRLPVGKRTTLAVLALVLPMTVLIAMTVVTLQRQETELNGAIDEAIKTLVPLATLEYDLQRAFTDDIEADSGESVPDFDGLTSSIDRAFTQLRSADGEPDIASGTIDDAAKAWQSARPTIERLVKRVRPLYIQDGSGSDRDVRAELDHALADVDQARVHLSKAVRSHVVAAQSAERGQLRILVWAWAATLVVGLLIIASVVFSVVRPTRDLGRAVRRLSSGDLSVRVDDSAKDEIAEVAAYLNSMAETFGIRRAHLQDEALRDDLTQLPNRRAILSSLESTLASARLMGKPVSVLLIDVDHFKSVNDRFGHAAGDQVLVWLAGRMRGALRQQDELGRYAGDEFLAVLPEASEEMALQIAKRLCDIINTETEPHKPSVTIGAATSPGDGGSSDTLIEAADRALYRGKDAGRGRVELAGA